MDDVVIKVEHLSKVYKLYDQKSDRLREALSFTDKKYYREFYALNDISFDVRRGETVGIIGTNGSGKSTLLKIITGVVAPSGGNYSVNGKVSALLELGAGFNMEYTGIQNIDLYGTMSGYTAEEMKTRREEIIRFADIGDYINQPVKNYSSGMFARLAFAAAISIDPEILIVDEALSVGDVFFQSKCFRKFDELMEKGTSILFVSHDTSQVRKMCSRVLWIEKGVQRMYGESDKVCKAYFNEMIQSRNAQVEEVIEKGALAEETIGEAPQMVRLPRIEPHGDSIFSDKVEVLSVYAKDSHGEYVHQLTADKSYNFGVVIKAHDDLDSLIIGFLVLNRKGENVIGENTFADGDISLTLKDGEIVQTEFTLTMPRIRSDQYTVSVGIAQGSQDSHVILSWLHGVITLEINRSGYEITEYGLPCTVKNMRLHEVEFI